MYIAQQGQVLYRQNKLIIKEILHPNQRYHQNKIDEDIPKRKNYNYIFLLT
jgi:hypothetical protein